jgi:hypothetical protein
MTPSNVGVGYYSVSEKNTASIIRVKAKRPKSEILTTVLYSMGTKHHQSQFVFFSVSEKEISCPHT